MANLSQSLLKGAKAYQGQNVVDRNELVVKYAPLVKRVAMHLKARLPASVDVNDLVQSGMIGLIEAIQNFKEGQGATFETYASIRIRGAIIDQLRQSDWTPRSVHQNTRAIRDAMLKLSHEKGRPATDTEIAAYLNVDINRYHQMLLDSNTSQVMGIEDTGLTDDVIGDKPLSEIVGQTPEDKLFDALDGVQFRDALAQAISQLPQREREILTFYYDQELNLREIGLIKGISESRTCQILSQAVMRLRASLEDWANPPKTEKHSARPKESLLAPGSMPTKAQHKRVSLLFNEQDEIEMRTAHGRALEAAQAHALAPSGGAALGGEFEPIGQSTAGLENVVPARPKKRAAKASTIVGGTEKINRSEQDLFVFINKTRSYLSEAHAQYNSEQIALLVEAAATLTGAQKLAQSQVLLQECLSKVRKLGESLELKLQDLDPDETSLSYQNLLTLQDELKDASADFLECLHQVNSAYQGLNPELKAQALSELAAEQSKPVRAKRTHSAKAAAAKASTTTTPELTVVKVPRRRSRTSTAAS